jgi:pyruvate/2-oxoglutarate dehydrogenase complex dihydrolipoamide acyltransferase (E2) component
MRGRSVKLSLPRRFMSDVCWTAHLIPLGFITGQVDISPLIEARRASRSRPPITALLAKAFALVAEEHPEFRSSYSPWPRPHLYEVPESVASIIMERDVSGEAATLPIIIKRVARLSIVDIASEIEQFRTAPVDSVPHLRRLMRFSRLPVLIRRFLWYLAFNIGRQRPNYFGTFAISGLGQFGARITRAVSPVSIILCPGPIQPNGIVEIVIGFDHRVFDGMIVAKAFGKIENALNGPILEEIRS